MIQGSLPPVCSWRVSSSVSLACFWVTARVLSAAAKAETCCQSLRWFLSDKVSEKLEVFEYFGTTARVMLTMFELTLAHLGQVMTQGLV